MEEQEIAGIWLRKTPLDTDEGTPGCHLGGLPNPAEAYDWPLHTLGDGALSVPMHFLGQINLDALPDAQFLPEMPRTGTLFFFFDPVYVDSLETGNNASAVIYVKEDVSDVPPRSVPEGLPVEESSFPYSVDWRYERNRTTQYKKWPVFLEEFWEVGEDAYFPPRILKIDSEKDRLPNYDGEPGRTRFFGPHGFMVLSDVFFIDAPKGAFRTGSIPSLVLGTDKDIGFQNGQMAIAIDPSDLACGQFNDVQFGVI